MADIEDLLTDALIFVGAYAQGQTPNTDDMSLAFRIVNRKIDSLSAEKLSMVGMRRDAFPLTGEALYSYGPSMDWAVPSRAIKIKSASVLATNVTERPCRVCTADEWAGVPDKSRIGVWIDDVFYDNGYPTGYVYVSPIPAAGTIILWVYQAIPALEAETGTVDLAPGYEEALVKIAAQDLCIAFQRPLTQELASAAAQSKDVIVQLNAELFNAPMPPPAGPGPTSPPAMRIT